MNVIERRELLLYGFRSWNNYDLAVKMLKSYKHEESKSISLLEGMMGESPIFACRFCRVPGYEHLLALANEEGKVAIQETVAWKATTANKVACIRGHENAIFDLAWSDCSLRMVTVSGDHTAMMWDLSASSIAPLAMFEGHSRSVKVAAFRPRDTNVFATGARDGMVITWDYRCAQQNATTIKPDNVIANAHCQSGSAIKRIRRKEPSSRADSITGLVFQDENFLISCSAGDGFIKVWDIRKCYSMYRRVPQACYTMPHPGNSAKNGFTSLSIDPGAVRLYANCMDNNIYCYNVATYEKTPVATYSGHQNQTFYVKSCLSADGHYLLSGSSDEKAYLWSVRRPGSPLARLVGHSAEVTCVDWAPTSDGEIKVTTCADDSCHLLWRLDPPTDTDEKPGGGSKLIGWVEWLDQATPSHLQALTPRTIKHRVHKQQRTPDCSENSKRYKPDTGETCKEERTVLADIQLPSVAKLGGARRLFDTDSSPQCSDADIQSPTSNLPNYVLEGTSPFHRCSSSASKQKENWLAKLQMTPSPKQPKKLSPKRRRQSQTTPKACGNLLKFFRVAAKQSTALNNNSCDFEKEAPVKNEIPTVLS